VGARVSRPGPLVLVDRDGTLNEAAAGTYVLEPDQVVLVPGAANGLRALRRSGHLLALVTNQAAVGRGWIGRDGLDAIHERLFALLRAEGAPAFDGVYVCPHRPEEGCGCRKPAPGLALRAARELGADLTAAFVVGDRAGDVELARRVGATSILVRTGQAGSDDFPHPPDHEAADLVEAAAIIAGLGRHATGTAGSLPPAPDAE
jgi:histidinol-phosphate phosphatase family protein